MKNTTITIGFILLTFSLAFSQKEDYIWRPMGYESTWLGTTGEIMNFNFNPPRIDSVINGMETFDVSTGICDSMGNMILYSNGTRIFNSIGIQILNSSDMNEYDSRFGCPLKQYGFTVPFPNHPNQYFFFAQKDTFLNYQGSPAPFWYPLKYSIIDMNAANGIGAVIQKNIPILYDSLMMGNLTACRHANGRDWWMLINKSPTTIWYRLLISPRGIEVIGIQDIGFLSGLLRFGGQCVFSPNGKLFAAINANDNSPTWDYITEVFDFDRCTGLLSRKVSVHITDTAYGCGVVFSPNSRFIYPSTNIKLHQFDLQALNVQASEVIVGTYDGYTAQTGGGNSLRYSQLGPNGKIYNSSRGSCDVLNVVNRPDSPGLACDFRQHQIQLPTYNGALPNYPNFRLGALRGSGCDTLTASQEINYAEKDKLRIYPNPVSDLLKIDLTMWDYHYQGRVAVVLFDVLGREVKRQVVSDFASIVHLEVSKLATGAYILCLEVEGQMVGAERVVVQRN
jgi:Secretion system C-terminal sorting domain